MVPANLGERLRQLEAADDDVYAIAVKRRPHHVSQELCAGWRVLRGLDHHAVARRQHLHERADREVEGEVPRNDVPHHALRLGLHESLARAVQGGI